MVPGVIAMLAIVGLGLQTPDTSKEATRPPPQEIVITEVPREETKTLLRQTDLTNPTETSPQAPEPKKVQAETAPPVQNEPSCHPSYSGCLNPNASDYDCAGGSGNGPYYTGAVQVVGYDEFDLDRDGDGWGCE